MFKYIIDFCIWYSLVLAASYLSSLLTALYAVWASRAVSTAWSYKIKAEQM